MSYQVKSVAFITAGLALGVSGQAGVADPQPDSQDFGHARMEINARGPLAEEAFLKVPGTCKWGHAAFAPIQTGSEPLSFEVQSIYAGMESA